MGAIVVVGLQWGDEGKGKLADILVKKKNISYSVRAQGGANAGHTIVIGDREYKFHLLPSAVLYPDVICYLASGVIFDPDDFLQEVKNVERERAAVLGRLWIAPTAHVALPFHKKLDQAAEILASGNKIGTTGKGIGPCYGFKARRWGIRVGDLLHPETLPAKLERALLYARKECPDLFSEQLLPDRDLLLHELKEKGKQLAPYIRPMENSLWEALQQGKRILLEGAQGTFLDLNFGIYPYVTSSNTTAPAICAAAGLPTQAVQEVLGVLKVYCTRVGEGPFPTEFQAKEYAQFLSHTEAREVGTTTGRLRRMGWWDGVMARYAIQLNGVSQLAVTKLDVLDRLEEISLCIGYKLNGKEIDTLSLQIEDFSLYEPIYETLPGWKASTTEAKKWSDLPQNAQKFLNRLEQICECPIAWISVGPSREQAFMKE